MCCPTSQGGKGLVPGTLNGLLNEQLVMALQASGEHHLCAMFHRELEGQSCFGVHLAIQVEHMYLGSSRRHGASESQNLEVLVVAL